MAKRGPKPKSMELKLIGGNPGKRPVRENDPARGLYYNAMPDPPPNMLNEHGQELWDDLGETLIERGVLTSLDYAPFATLCAVYGIAAAAAEHIRRDGEIVLDDKGRPKKHPALSVLRDFAKMFNSTAALFGLNPSDRQRLNISVEPTRPQGMEKLLSPAKVIRETDGPDGDPDE